MSEKEPHIEEDLLNAIMEAWSKFPDMRLTQLLINAINPKEPCSEIYAVEDSELIKYLNRLKEE
jgi:hypothetical protein